MKSRIPCELFALAAERAADLFCVGTAEVFIGQLMLAKRSRAFAIAAMIKAFPEHPRYGIAQGFGFDGSKNALWSMINQARKQKWWADIYVERIAEAIEAEFSRAGNPYAEFDDTGSLVLRDETDKRAARFVPRNWKPARIIQQHRFPARVTGALLGDPPPGRREFLSTLPSLGYSAGRQRGAE